MTSPRIAVVGAGAIGCRIAAHLAQSGVACTLFDGWSDHVAAINERGLRLQHGSEVSTFKLPAHDFSAATEERFDIILLAVRSDATAQVLPLVHTLLASDGYVVSCQNGINEDAISVEVGAERTLGCFMVFGARLTAPGCVEVLAGPDTLTVGELNGTLSDRVQQLASLLACCGTVTVSDNLIGYRWMKLVLNSTGNPLLLLTGLDGRSLHAREDARELIIGITREILSTAAAAGVRAEPPLGQAASVWLDENPASEALLHQALQQHGEALGERRLSMVADFAARGRTEVDHLNGYAIRKAAEQGRSLPLNQAVVEAVHALQAGKIQPSPEVLQGLARGASPGESTVK